MLFGLACWTAHTDDDVFLREDNSIHVVYSVLEVKISIELSTVFCKTLREKAKCFRIGPSFSRTPVEP